MTEDEMPHVELSSLATEIILWSDSRGIHIGFWDVEAQSGPVELDLRKARYVHTQTPQMMLRFAVNMALAALSEMDAGRLYGGRVGAPEPLAPDARQRIYDRVVREFRGAENLDFDEPFWAKQLGNIIKMTDGEEPSA